VAISVTTIPAAAYLGVAAGVGELDKVLGALAVLAVNVLMISLGGAATLLTQRRLTRRYPADG
jgi:sorbitol-specific phosphotransferase system component IIC